MTRVWTLAAILSLFVIAPSHALAQSENSPLSVAAGGLINPRGFTFGSEDELIVAETGTGGEDIASEVVPDPLGPYRGGPTGQISSITDGCPTPLVTGLPSARGAGGQTLGPVAIAVIDDQIYVLESGGGAAHAHSEQPAGIYNVTSGSPVLVADLGAWLRENPVSTPPEPALDPDGEWSAMAAEPDGTSFVVVESNSEQVVRVGLDGSITRIADLSAGNQTPTALAIGSDGAIYVGNLSAPPYAAGSANVIRIGADGTTEVVWSGLTMVTGLAIDQQGTLYAAELSASRERPPVIQPGTGRIVRQTGADAFEEVVTQLNLPTAIAFGPEGALYVSLPLVGADAGSGQILRADIAGTLPIRAEDSDLASPSCGSASESTLIKVSDLGIEPPSITITVGATVTWRNTGEFDHAVTSDPASALQWDSGPLRPGEEFSQTFDEPGSYTYFDGLFPDHTGSIEVVATP
ncbi:MAG TPA: ScyD/ScyE family protein [Nitrolancea sp.]|nr:ScyD/ScyE family protein [Nitrolancea sp.]